jgi:hypothetical protein
MPVAEKVDLVGVVASSTAGFGGCVGGGWDRRCGAGVRASFWIGDDVGISSMLGGSGPLDVLTERNPDIVESWRVSAAGSKLEVSDSRTTKRPEG